MSTLKAVSALLAFVPFVLSAQVAPTRATSEAIVEQISPSVALVLTGDGSGRLSSVASAVVIRANGILLTAYHVVKTAREVQIKFKNGETFDSVQLLGVDKRRDVAALQITGANFPALPVVFLASVQPGTTVFAVSQAGALPWSASSGVVSAIRPADEVPGAGTGYRLIQFSAPVSPGSSGGLLVDQSGKLLGIVVGSVSGQNLNFAVPIESVLGLGDQPVTTAFTPGSKLTMPSPKPSTEPSSEGIDVSGPEKSDIIESRDPQVILRKFRTLYVRCNSVWMKDEVVKNALRNRPEFAQMGLVLVESPKLADAILSTDRVLFTWDFTYSLQHQNTSIVLAMGKFTAIDGMAAAARIASDVVNKIKIVRMPPGEAPPSANTPPVQKQQ